MKTTYILMATFEDFSISEIKVEVEALNDALALARGYLCATNARRVSIRTDEHGVLQEYKRT